MVFNSLSGSNLNFVFFNFLYNFVLILLFSNFTTVLSFWFCHCPYSPTSSPPAHPSLILQMGRKMSPPLLWSFTHCWYSSKASLLPPFSCWLLWEFPGLRWRPSWSCHFGGRLVGWRWQCTSSMASLFGWTDSKFGQVWRLALILLWV